jgi:hypothetical protein
MGQSLTHQIDQSPSTVGAGTASVNLRLRIWYQSTASVWDTTNTFQVSGSWPSRNTAVSIDVSTSGGATVQQLIYDETISVSTQYAETVTRSFAASLTGINYWGSSQVISRSGSKTVAARPYSAPAAPSGVAASRTSDTRHTVSWTRNATTGAPYSSQRVRRRMFGPSGWGSWTTIATLSGTATSYVDEGTVGNRAYEWQVQAVNSAGTTTSASTATFHTTPVAPTSVTAAKTSSGDIRVTFDGFPPYSAYVAEVWESTNGGSSWTKRADVPSGTSQWLHTSPSAALPHQYRVRYTTTATVVVSSGYTLSGTVQLISAPNPPSGLGPSTPADASEPRTLAWTHNPVDTSPQTAFEVRYRHDLDATWWGSTGKVTSTAEQWVMPADTLANGLLAAEWAVRTWGAHANPSDWSATAQYDLRARPTVAIDTPADAATLATSRLETAWTFFQAQGEGQAAWRATLLSSGQALEVQSGVAGTFATAFDTNLEDGTSYVLRLEVQSASGLWSEATEISFGVAYPAPADGVFAVEWIREQGATQITITPDNADLGVTEDAATASVLRSLDDGQTWATVIDHVAVAPGEETVVVDPIPTIAGQNRYRVVFYTALGAARVLGDGRIVATNGFPNPRLGVGTTGWYSQGTTTLTRVDDGDGPEGDDTWARFARPGGDTTAINYVLGGSGTGTNGAAVPPSTPVTGSIYVRPTATIQVRAALNERSAAGAQVAETLGDPVTCPADQWTRIDITVTTASTTAFAGVRIALAAAQSWAAFTIGAGAMQVEEGTEPSAYINGANLPDGLDPAQFHVAWVGAVDASASRLSQRHDDQYLETAEPGLSFFNYGPQFATVASMLARPQPGGTAGREKAYHRFAGRPRRVLFSSESTSLAVAAGGRLVEDTSTLTDWETAAIEAGVGCYRDPKGRRIFGGLEGFTHQWISPTVVDVTFTVEEADHSE